MTAKDYQAHPQYAAARERAASILRTLDTEALPPAKARGLSERAELIRCTTQAFWDEVNVLAQREQKLARYDDAELKGQKAICRVLGERASAVRAELAQCAASDRRRLERELEMLTDTRQSVEFGDTARTTRADDGDLIVESTPIDSLQSWRPPKALRPLWREHGVALDALAHGSLRRCEQDRRALLSQRARSVSRLEQLLAQLRSLA